MLKWGWAALLVLAVIVIYLPVWRAGFVWDDFSVLVQNKCIAGPLGLKEIWTTRAADICPLTITTFYFEHAFWGFVPRPYHVVNVLLHASSAVVFWRVLLALEIPGAWLGAALWALHPVEAESVAWVVELKNTQSALCFLLSIFFFLRWLRDETARSFALMLVCAFLAMASKSSTVILPVVLILCAWWRQRLDLRMVMRLIPVFLLAAAAGLLSLWTQNHSLQANSSHWDRPWPERIATSGDAFWFYLGKLIWPHPLVTIYPRWPVDALTVGAYFPALAALVLLTFLAAFSSGWARPWFMAYAYFLVALLPALGLLDNLIFRYSLVFDHLQYLASMGPLAMVGAGISLLGKRLKMVQLPAVLGAGLLALLGALTWQRASTFHSDTTLWQATLPVNPQCWVAYNNLGSDAFNRDETAQAIADYKKSLALTSYYPDSFHNLAVAYNKEGRLDDEIADLDQALVIFPNDATFHSLLGEALVEKDQMVDGINELQRAVQLDPNVPRAAEALDTIGTDDLHKGAIDDAIRIYQQALVLEPNLARAQYNLGLAFAQKGNIDDAIAAYQRSLAIDPADAEVHNNLGTTLVQKGRFDEAFAEFQQAVTRDPHNGEARRNLGTALLQRGQLDAAIEELTAALAATPNDAALHTLLGLAEGKKGNFPAAINQFREALRLNPDDAAVQRYLEQAQAAAGSK